MEERVLRVGIIGARLAEAIHVPSLRQLPSVEIAAICASTSSRARSLAARFQIPQYFDDPRVMLRRAGLDAVTIATPLDQRHSAAIAAAERGVHILCERPMARTAAEARDMLRLAGDAGVQHAVACAGRFTATRIRFKQLIDRGYLGELESVSVNVYRTSGWQRRFGPATLDEEEIDEEPLQTLGSDYIDALRWWFGEIHGVAGATAASAPLSGPNPCDDSSFAIVVQFANGALGSMHVSTNAPVDLGDELVAVGSNAMIALRSDGRLFGALRHERAIREFPIPTENTENLPSFPDPRILPFTLLANEWIHGILTGSGTAPSFEDGMKVQEVVDAVQRSQELGRWVDTSGKKWPI